MIVDWTLGNTLQNLAVEALSRAAMRAPHPTPAFCLAKNDNFPFQLPNSRPLFKWSHAYMNKLGIGCPMVDKNPSTHFQSPSQLEIFKGVHICLNIPSTYGAFKEPHPLSKIPQILEH